MLKEAKRVIDTEIKALIKLKRKLDNKFELLINEITTCSGKIITTGIGKSGLVAQKFAASLASIGVSSFFIHPAEAAHGDLGMVTANDLLIIISNSGETEEIIKIIPIVKEIGTKIISFVGNLNSYIAKNSNLSIDIGVDREADYLNLLPTASTTTAACFCDAVVCTIAKLRSFKKEDLALLHPSGRIGKLLLKVKELMHHGDENPVISELKDFKEALFVITTKRLGAVSCVDKKGRLVGIITDGDVRRLVQRSEDELDKLFSMQVRYIMTKTPKVIYPDQFATEAVKKMEDHNIFVLPVVNENYEPIGMLHLHDLVKAGLTLEKK